MDGKLIIVSAPSGCGKSSIINAIMQSGEVEMEFSVSATNRPPRQGEIDGVHYRFLTTEEFDRHIAEGHFVEYEEVYPGRFYGTLRAEIDRICDSGRNCILDIDVKGAVNVKREFGSRALSIFIMPPSIEELRRRLENRGTETEEWIQKRVDRAEEEISFSPQFDAVVVNDDLSTAIEEVKQTIKRFIG